MARRSTRPNTSMMPPCGYCGTRLSVLYDIDGVPTCAHCRNEQVREEIAEAERTQERLEMRPYIEHEVRYGDFYNG